MSIFGRILKKITRKDEDSKLRRLLDRISQLNKFKSEQEGELSKLQSKSIDTSWYKLSSKESNRNDVSIFSPRSFGSVKTMAGLQEMRAKEEEEQLFKIKNAITEKLAAIDAFLTNEEVNKAEDTLYQASSLLKTIKDDSLNSIFFNLTEKFNSLKSLLLQREKERIEQAKKSRIEAEERERERIRIENENAAKERERIEREAREYEEKLALQEQERANEISRLTSIVTQPKDDAQVYLNYLRLNGVNCFYHFTDELNLKSIRSLGGLYSWYYCQQNNIKIPNVGGDNLSHKLDMQQGLEDYVRLSFCDDHPMAYAKWQAANKNNKPIQLVLLKIKIDVAAFKDTQFSEINAATSGNSHGKTIVDLRKVNIYATQRNYVSRDEEIFHQHQAECMVKTFIPIKYITNINTPKKMYF